MVTGDRGEFMTGPGSPHAHGEEEALSAAQEVQRRPERGRLRAIDADTGLGNNYCLTVLLENLDEIADRDRLAEAYRRFIHERCGPEEP